MDDLLTDVWRHQGCSLVWNESLLLVALGDNHPYALHTALRWPTITFPKVGVGAAVVVAGLQVCLELAATPAEATDLLRGRIQPLIRAWQAQLPGSALIFALATPVEAWSFDASERALLTMRTPQIIEAGQALWSGAASDAQRIMTEDNGKATKPKHIFGGLYVRRLS